MHATAKRNKNMNWKKFLPDVLAVVFFVAVSVSVFLCPIRDGLVLTGTTTAAASAAVWRWSRTASHTHGERTRWTNTLFSGMPTYQMAPSYPSTDTLSSPGARLSARPARPFGLRRLRLHDAAGLLHPAACL